ncbi:MAG TPA: AbrB/MazE/SpoVT family DNA-binding domain-containing protein [Gammaproteobacteria bacterium]|nr:AbrB/MazE/SpoVT family DNA-binding domain-containing protein [Gammaproteobacteria bacterium]
MKSLATTKMSSKGQVVIPEEIRKALNLTEGNQFVVLGEKDVIILKIVTPPSMKDFDHLIVKARSEAKKTGLKKNDIQKILKNVRKEK